MVPAARPGRLPVWTRPTIPLRSQVVAKCRIPNPAEAGKDLGILNMANTLSSVIGAALASGLVMTTNNYMLIFPACIVVVLLGSVLILCIRGVK